MHIMDIYQGFGYRVILKSQPPGYSFKTKQYDQFQVIYVFSGALRFESEYQKVVLGEGGIALLPVLSRFRLSAGKMGYSGVGFVASSGSTPIEWAGSHAYAMQASSHAHMLGELMRKEIFSPGPAAVTILRGLGHALAWETISIAKAHRQWRLDTNWPHIIKSALDATCQTYMPVSEVLNSLPMTYRHACRIFSSRFGMSPKAYQMQQKIQNAKRLLAETSMKVTEIAMEIGFSSSQHFANTFKAHTGLSPTIWAKEYRRTHPTMFEFCFPEQRTYEL